MLGKVWFHTTEQVAGRPRFDLVVLDGPATGHALTLLAIPKVICDTVPEGPLTGPARECLSLLTDETRCQTVLVTLAEDLPVSRAFSCRRGCVSWGCTSVPSSSIACIRRASAAGVNALALEELLATATTTGPSALPAEVLHAANLQRQRSALNEHYLKTLHTGLPLPQLHAPYLFTAQFARAAIETLADRLAEQIDAQAQSLTQARRTQRHGSTRPSADRPRPRFPSRGAFC